MRKIHVQRLCACALAILASFLGSRGSPAASRNDQLGGRKPRIEQTYADCQAYTHRTAPKYRVARKYEMGPEGNPIPWVHVSVAEKFINRDDLIALACQLRRDFAKEKTIWVVIFDNFKAAKIWVPLGDTFRDGDSRPPRAQYEFDRDTGENYVHWYPEPMDMYRVIRINLDSITPK